MQDLSDFTISSLGDIELGFSVSEEVLQSELNDSWSARSSGCGATPAVTVRVVICRTAKDFAESISCAQGSSGISGPQAVGDVERLRAKFNPFSFGDLEVPRYGLIPFPKSRPDKDRKSTRLNSSH